MRKLGRCEKCIYKDVSCLGQEVFCNKWLYWFQRLLFLLSLSFGLFVVGLVLCAYINGAIN